MKIHTKVYLEHYGYDKTDFIACELCGKKAVDIHHIEAKGLGGSKEKDFIENLIALCRECHTKCHSYVEINKHAKSVHMKNL